MSFQDEYEYPLEDAPERCAFIPEHDCKSSSVSNKGSTCLLNKQKDACVYDQQRMMLLTGKYPNSKKELDYHFREVVYLYDQFYEAVVPQYPKNVSVPFFLPLSVDQPWLTPVSKFMIMNIYIHSMYTPKARKNIQLGSLKNDDTTSINIPTMMPLTLPDMRVISHIFIIARALEYYLEKKSKSNIILMGMDKPTKSDEENAKKHGFTTVSSYLMALEMTKACIKILDTRESARIWADWGETAHPSKYAERINIIVFAMQHYNEADTETIDVDSSKKEWYAVSSFNQSFKDLDIILKNKNMPKSFKRFDVEQYCTKKIDSIRSANLQNGYVMLWREVEREVKSSESIIGYVKKMSKGAYRSSVDSVKYTFETLAGETQKIANNVIGTYPYPKKPRELPGYERKYILENNITKDLINNTEPDTDDMEDDDDDGGGEGKGAGDSLNETIEELSKLVPGFNGKATMRAK